MQRSRCDVNRFVIHAMRFHAGHFSRAAHDRNATIGVVEHDVGAVERTAYQDAGGGVGNHGFRQVGLPARFDHDTRPQALAVRTLGFRNDRREKRGLFGHQRPIDVDGVGFRIHRGARGEGQRGATRHGHITGEDDFTGPRGVGRNRAVGR